MSGDFLGRNEMITQFAFDGDDQKFKKAIHIYVKNRTTTKFLTIVENLGYYLTNKQMSGILKTLCKILACGGVLYDGEKDSEDSRDKVLEFLGDHRQKIAEFLVHDGIVTRNDIKIHGY